MVGLQLIRLLGGDTVRLIEGAGASSYGLIWTRGVADEVWSPVLSAAGAWGHARPSPMFHLGMPVTR